MDTTNNTDGRIYSDFYVKDRALVHADGDLAKAKSIYTWLMENARPADVKPADNVKPAPADKDLPAAPTPKAEKATKPKAEKPAEPAKEAEKAKAPPAEKEAAKPNLSYDTDVLPEILATLNRLTTAGASTDDGKAAIVNMMSSQFGVKNAKDVKPERWAELVTELKSMGA